MSCHFDPEQSEWREIHPPVISNECEKSIFFNLLDFSSLHSSKWQKFTYLILSEKLYKTNLQKKSLKFVLTFYNKLIYFTYTHLLETPDPAVYPKFRPAVHRAGYSSKAGNFVAGSFCLFLIWLDFLHRNSILKFLQIS